MRALFQAMFCLTWIVHVLGSTLYEAVKGVNLRFRVSGRHEVYPVALHTTHASAVPAPDLPSCFPLAITDAS